MTTELVPFSLSDLPAVSDEQLETLDDVKAQSKFLPRLQLASSSCDLCKTGKCKPGVWIIPNGTDCIELGDSIDVMPIALRDKAMDMNDKKNIVTCFDSASDEYARIKSLKKRVYWGTSYLVFVRGHDQLLELYFGNASGRQESDKLKPFLPRPDREARTATVNIKYREGREFSWHVPVIVKCSDPLVPTVDMKIVLAEHEKFLNPPATAEVETEDEAPKGRAR